MDFRDRERHQRRGDVWVGNPDPVCTCIGCFFEHWAWFGTLAAGAD